MTRADVVCGYLHNTADPHGRAGTTQVSSPPSSVDLPLGTKVTLSLDEQVDDTRTYKAGDQAYYDYVVTNTSDQPVDRLAIDDDKIDDVSCAATELAANHEPGDSTVCTGTSRAPNSPAPGDGDGDGDGGGRLADTGAPLLVTAALAWAAILIAAGLMIRRNRTRRH
ncbi:hypothetical protein ACFPK5_25180 [Streptomyces beijiangensis]